ncbi:MAG: hypothetical protein ACYCYF_09605 [Anaerolineae bacterium]
MDPAVKASIDAAALQDLRTSFRGALMQPTDADYDERRTVWNGSIDRHPALIARCTGVEDVMSAVRFAPEQGPPAGASGAAVLTPSAGAQRSR